MFDNVDLMGDEVTLPAHVDIELSGGVLLGGFECEVDLRHDGDDWMLSGVSYCSDFGGPSDDFDAEALRTSAPDGSLRDLVRREVLQLLNGQYSSLADAASIKARAAVTNAVREAMAGSAFVGLCVVWFFGWVALPA